ncbi:hypothetical protein [Solidesulfovibrio alcoholivorans]|uniref:hypothetical protein n=1 Tax=Solidesulfovibrio alcoholivorans TaxID=81406 RepID=UPI00069425C5|nr:hypothetical protein [Solidesulfovibrio alcoholivorans]
MPLELFIAPPFDLALETLAAVLAAMAADPAFRDIASTTTSSGEAYLFSSLYLEHDHAAFLAEQDASCVLTP